MRQHQLQEPKTPGRLLPIHRDPVFVENNFYEGWNIGDPEKAGYICCWNENVWGKSAAGFVTIVLSADDLQKTYEEIKAEGLDIPPPVTAGWGGLELTFQNPDGSKALIL